MKGTRHIDMVVGHVIRIHVADASKGVRGEEACNNG